MMERSLRWAHSTRQPSDDVVDLSFDDEDLEKTIASDRSTVDIEAVDTKSDARQSMYHRRSFTKSYVPKMSDGAMLRPRGSQVERDAASFTTRAHRPRVYRSMASRLFYTMVLLNIVIFTPLWLKLLTLRREETRKGPDLVLYNASVEVELNVSTFLDPQTTCGPCSKTDFGVTYPVKARVRNFVAQQNVPTPAYASLLASYDFDSWFVVSKPGLLTGLQTGRNDIDVCRGDEPEDDDDDEDLEEITTEKKNEKKTTFVTKFEDGYSSEEWTTTWTTPSPTTVAEQLTPAPTPSPEDAVSRCCLDQPGFIYLVLCVSPFEYLRRASFYDRVDPTFQAQCVGLTGRCGASCGVDARAPVPETCVDGVIPLDKLLPQEKKAADDGPRFYDQRFKTSSRQQTLYLNSFVTFVTLMVVGTWVSFFSGTGYLDDPLKPSMSEVEAYLAEDTKDFKQPLCCVAFSISAAEPRMMVLRNMVGKYMSWIYQRKFTLSLSKTTSIFAEDKNVEASAEIKLEFLSSATQFFYFFLNNFLVFRFSDFLFFI